MDRMRKIFLALGTVAFVLIQLSPNSAAVEKAEVVYLNGNIYTVNDQSPKASAMAIKGGKFVYVGSRQNISEYIEKTTRVFDLRGKTVIPGLIDSHLHFSAIGQLKMKLNVFWKPKKEILDLVARAYQKNPKGEWIEGFGWNQEVWEPPIFPAKEDLDKIAPDAPVYLVRTDGHAAWVNSKALELAGLSGSTLNPQGGEIIRDGKGELTGILTDSAMAMVSRKIPPVNKKKMVEALELAQEELVSNGITSGQDAGCDLEMIDILKSLYESGRLSVRLYVRLTAAEKSSVRNDDFLAKGIQVGLYQNRLTIRGIKIFIDGALGSRGAYMLAPYSDRPDSYLGNRMISEERLYALVKQAGEAGFQVSTHAIGDAATRMALNAYEKALSERPDRNHRYRIEHAQVATLEDIPRFARLGVIPSMQTVHATSDMNMAEKRVGPERIKGAYAWRKFLDSGSIIANGTDAPVERLDPFHGLYAAVTRQDRNGLPRGGWYPGERMTREEALKSYTLWPAYAAFEEKVKGSIESGKLADFVVIDRDYMSCREDEIKDIRVLKTVLGGQIVYPAGKRTR